MEIRELWSKTTATGREVFACFAGGFFAWFFALWLGAESGIAMFFGLIVFGGLGAVALYAWAQSNKKNGKAIGVDIGTGIMICFGVLGILGIFFLLPDLAFYSFWGIVAGLAITVVSAISRHPE